LPPLGEHTPMDISLEALDQAGAEHLPGLLGIEFDSFEDGIVRSRLTLEKNLFAPNGYVHAGAIVTLADTTCGYGCILSFPEGATGFTTIELKTNFLSSARVGERVVCRCTPAHLGRQTQVWDAEITNESTGRRMALFRCTQMVLPPR